MLISHPNCPGIPPQNETLTTFQPPRSEKEGDEKTFSQKNPEKHTDHKCRAQSRKVKSEQKKEPRNSIEKSESPQFISHHSKHDQTKKMTFSSRNRAQELRRPKKESEISNSEIDQSINEYRSQCDFRKNHQQIVLDYYPSNLVPDPNLLHDPNPSKKCVGRLKCYSKSGPTSQEPQMTIEATAFLIASRILVTVAHAIRFQKTRKHFYKAIFIPNESAQQEVYQTEDREEYINYEEEVNPLDYAVLILKTPLKLSKYFQLTPTVLKPKDSLQIWSWGKPNLPESNPTLTLPREGHQMENVLFGKFVQSFGNTKQKYGLVHTIQTKDGDSGTPIIKRTKQADRYLYQVVGIHTHRGKTEGTNQGIHFSKDNISNILKWSIKLSKYHNSEEFQAQVDQLINQLKKIQRPQKKLAHQIKQVLIDIKESS